MRLKNKRLATVSKSDPTITEFEEQIDDGPRDDSELDGPEHGRTKKRPARAVPRQRCDAHFNQEQWAPGTLVRNCQDLSA
jgi:hypothetical protein